METLEGKVAIVTGGGQGVGRGIASAFLQQGAAVTITGLEDTMLENTQHELDKLANGRVRAIVADGCKDSDVTNAVDLTVKTFGGIDILVNNAQTSVYGMPLEETSREVFDTVFESGLYATHRYIVAAMPYLKKAHGSIINLVSDAGIQGFANYSAYAANKEAIRAITRVAARELGPYGVNANAMVVAMLTEAAQAWLEENPEAAKAQAKASPLGYLGDPEIDAGGAAVFLASRAGRYLTGETLNVNGGRYMRP